MLGLALSLVLVSCAIPGADGSWGHNLGSSPPPDAPAFWEAIKVPVLHMDQIAIGFDPENVLGRLRVYANAADTATPANPSYLVSESPLSQSVAAYRIRGQSSSGMPKKSFALELRKDWTSDTSNNLYFLGMPAENDWVLHASWSDKSLMRNHLVYTLGARLGSWQPRTRFVELRASQLDGDLASSYQGIYLALERIKRDDARVRLAPWSAAAAPESVGYLLKIDKGGGSEWPILGPAAANLSVVDPDATEISSEQKLWIKNYILDMEAAMQGASPYDPVLGYPRWLDRASFIDFFLMNEFAKNIDGYRISSFMTKDAGGKLKAGPLWDFDIALGNADYYEGGDTSNWMICRMLDGVLGGDSFQPPFWWEVLLKDPAFRSQAQQRWRELRAEVLSDQAIAALIEANVARLASAVQREFSTWDRLRQYDWPNVFPIPGNPKSPDDYVWLDHVNYLRAWIQARVVWMDSAAAWQGLDAWAAQA